MLSLGNNLPIAGTSVFSHNFAWGLFEAFHSQKETKKGRNKAGRQTGFAKEP